MSTESQPTGRVLLLEDRYQGVYSKGTWLGIIDPDAPHGDGSRGAFVVDRGPSDGDMGAAAFWDNPPDWIVAGNSPKHVMDLISTKCQERRHG